MSVVWIMEKQTLEFSLRVQLFTREFPFASLFQEGQLTVFSWHIPWKF